MRNKTTLYIENHRLKKGETIFLGGQKWRVVRVGSQNMFTVERVIGDGIFYVCLLLTLGMAFCFGYGIYKIFF